MTQTLAVPVTFTAKIGLGDDVNKDLTFNPQDFDGKVLERILKYGLQRIFNDCSGGKDGDKWSAVQKRFDAFKRGELRAERVGGERDPVGKEAHSIALKRLQADGSKFMAWAKENSLTSKDKAYRDTLAERAKAVMHREDIQALAKANVAAVKDIDLGDDI